MSTLNGPGEGTWSVFAEKVTEERDELLDILRDVHDVFGMGLNGLPATNLLGPEGTRVAKRVRAALKLEPTGNKPQ